MLKALQKIAAAEGTKCTSKRSHPGVTFCVPSNEVLENLVESCVGDIRAAVNALQFMCLQGGLRREGGRERGREGSFHA